MHGSVNIVKSLLQQVTQVVMFEKLVKVQRLAKYQYNTNYYLEDGT